MAGRPGPEIRRASNGPDGKFAERARLYEDDPGVRRDVGLVERLSGRFDAAAGALQISVALEPDRASVKFLLAQACLGQRRADEARTLLKQVPPTDPFYKSAQGRLKQLAPPR